MKEERLKAIRQRDAEDPRWRMASVMHQPSKDRHALLEHIAELESLLRQVGGDQMKNQLKVTIRDQDEAVWERAREEAEDQLLPFSRYLTKLLLEHFAEQNGKKEA